MKLRRAKHEAQSVLNAACPRQVPRREARRVLIWLQYRQTADYFLGPRSAWSVGRGAELFKRQGARRDALRGGAYRPLDLGRLASLFCFRRCHDRIHEKLTCPQCYPSADGLQAG
ncbi:MAG: hypothetical protein PHW60_10585 [Kiritimatiellae bacterium]|nr:hypothetical protein [Kiritimatiellia bacterium]